jgi:prepilin-type N-terminal cleavage/methylation domain-containing protein
MAIKKAFSLIELLVVVALIGILTAIATASYSTMQKKARDSRRVADMKAVQNAFEQYYADFSTYNCSLSATYLPYGFPTDPKGSDPYVYTGSSSCTATTYCYCALLEVSSGNSGAACSSGSSYYCVSQRQ